MNRAALLLPLLWLLTPGVAPTANAAQLSYTLDVLAIPLADATLDLDLSQSAYRIGLRFHTVGVARVFSDASLDEHAAGRFEGGMPAPAEFHSLGERSGAQRIMGLAWRGGMPVVTAMAPPRDGEREDVPAALLANTIDPMSAVMLLFRRASQTGRCDASARAYNGLRLQLIEARTGGDAIIPPSSQSSYTGPALRCDFTERTISGLPVGPGRDDDARPRRGSIWLAQVLSGLPRLPVRISLETRWFGDATIYLTAAVP